MIRILIVEDIPLFRVGLRSALEQMRECEIIGEATDPADILQVALAQRPDVVLLNQGLATAPAFDIARLLVQSEQRGVFVLADPPSEELLFQYQLVGAAAYEARWVSGADLAQKMQRVSAGEYLFSGDSLAIPHKDLLETPEVPSFSDCPLSTRDAQILVYIAQGMSNKQIARTLSMSDQTVKNLITAILRTLGVADRTAAVVEAWRQNWMMLDSSESGHQQKTGRAREGGATRPSQQHVLLPSQKEVSLISSPPTSEVRYHLQTAFCGKPGCRLCHAGTGHGPYWYAYQTIGGRTVRRYVGKTLPSPVLSAPPVSGCE